MENLDFEDMQKLIAGGAIRPRSAESQTRIKSIHGLPGSHIRKSRSATCVKTGCMEPRHDDVECDSQYLCTRRCAVAGCSAVAVYTSNQSIPLHTLKEDYATRHSVLGASAEQISTAWSLSDGGSMLRVREDGTMTLCIPEIDTSRQNLAITLPKYAAETPARELSSSLGAPKDAALSLYWPGGVYLNIWCVPSSLSHGTREKFSGWTGGIDQGYLLEIIIEKRPLEDQAGLKGAELVLDLSRGVHWFGGAHMLRQIWPLDRAQWEVGPLYPFDHGPNGLGSIVGCHWLSSAGSIVMVDPKTPVLHFGLNSPTELTDSNPRYFGVGVQHLAQPVLPILEHGSSATEGDGKMRIQTRVDWNDKKVLHPWQTIDGPTNHVVSHDDSMGGFDGIIKPRSTDGHVVLRVGLAAKTDIRAAAWTALGSLPRPKHPPPDVLFRRSIWTTWATSHADVTQRQVVSLANAVIENGFIPGVLEIDDRWQSHYGELEFDHKKFPDPKKLVDELHNLGFLVTLWVMPFLQEGSAACEEARSHGYVVAGNEPPSIREEISIGGAGQRIGSTVKVLVDKFDWPPGHWEGGGGGGRLRAGQVRWWGTQPVWVLDLTNDMAVDWFVTRLKRLQDTMGIDGFKFDAGEPCFLPRGSETSRPLEYPGEYTQIWVNKVASRFPISEVRSGYLTTEYSGLVRMGDRDSVWGLDNGLQSLIPALLTSSVLGYHFCMPDMVGGNAYWGQYPDTELIVRWAQVSVMMPFVQWSIPPWDVSEIANALCLAAERDRQIILLPRLSELTAKASASLSPICRPLWWLDPLDEETYAIDDQFAVGDDIIIAPVVEKGARWRRLYLPVGEWFGWEREMHGNIQDDNTYFDVSDTIIGPCWITVDAPLEKLPIFIKL